MTDDREQAVAKAFVGLASSLASGYDVVDLLNQLTGHCVGLLGVPAAGLLLADGMGQLHLMATAPDLVRQFELFQLAREEGPWHEAFQTGGPVSIADLTKESGRWPQFTAAAREAGFVSVHALPMRLRDNVLGVLGLFGDTTEAVALEDLALGQALADVASVALVQDRAAADRVALNEQLQMALASRIVIEQAKGLIAQTGDLDMVASFGVLRRYARDHNRRLTEVAEQVVARHLSAAVLLNHSRSAGAEPG